MSIYSSRLFIQLQSYFSVVVIVAMLFSAVPATVFAGEVPAEDEPVGDVQDGSETQEGNVEAGESTGGQEETGTGAGTDGAPGTDGTTNEAGIDGQSAESEMIDTSGEDGASGSEGEAGEEGGTGEQVDEEEIEEPYEYPEEGFSEEGGEGSLGGEVGSEEGEETGDIEGQETIDGEAGADAQEVSEEQSGVPEEETEAGNAGADVTENAEDSEYDPVLVVSENTVADDSTPDDGEEVTGSQTIRSYLTRVEIETGKATAQVELLSDANSGDVKSEVEESALSSDFDNYYFNATGTNDAIVTNTGEVIALTGDNFAQTRGGPAEIVSGDAYGAINIANVVNSTVVNSHGFLYLGNRIPEPQQSLDLTDLFYPDAQGELARAEDCSLLSCVSEDIHYNFSQMNTATVTNNASLEVTTGFNEVDTETSFSDISTGEAYGAANVMNVVNTNIVDSNYRFLTVNALGDLDGDLLLPTQDLFTAFYSRPNGMTQLEDAEDAHLLVENTNEADVNNDIDAYAETGLNIANTSVQPLIMTGDAESESNVLNKVNENIFGGDVLYLLVRVHGAWNGEVRGLPEGLDWMWTSEGVLIYNEGSEIAPSPLLSYDVDSYNAEVTDYNNVTINNNVTIEAITGQNEVAGGTGSVITGDAFASANVMNIANTNVIGANWTFAVVNIFGDFTGDITFSEIDLTLTGDVTGDDQLGPGDLLTYVYTVHNNSTVPATNVVIEQTLEHATAVGGEVVQSVHVGDIDPGESVTAELTAYVDEDLPIGTTSVNAVAVVQSDEAEATTADNALLLSLLASFSEDVEQTGTTSTSTGSGETGEEDENTSSGSDTTDENETTETGNTGSSGGSGGGGGGGGGSSSKTKSIDREQKRVDPDKPSTIRVEKTAVGIDVDDIVRAGTAVDYEIVVTNSGGTAYDAVVYDTLKNPIGSVLSEQSWDLGTILPGEEITLSYTTTYDLQTPSGTYTNTAWVEAYKEENAKAANEKPLQLSKAVHTIEIEGVDLAIGNVGVVAYYPGVGGKVNALVTWETSKPASGQVFYSAKSAGSVYSPLLPNFGYQNASFRFNTPKTKHYMILRDLTPGVQYGYKIRSTNGTKLAVRGDYEFTVPGGVLSIALALPDGRVAQVAGATVTILTVPTTAPVTKPVTNYTPPSVTPTNKIEPEPVSETPEPIVNDDSDDQKSGLIGGVAKKVFSFFSR